MKMGVWGHLQQRTDLLPNALGPLGINVHCLAPVSVQLLWTALIPINCMFC